ncbi:ankyrin repeat domain-containing protein [Armatimonas rosea]|uniref:Ankyrin repeat protein n=1 Tax=Armatimonas rosea TaxID=685828 RepID=A0A7W9SPR3_ARMRO|nr:ankyrin repeat domain-containing protein [Armatimonas rosea]MBB6049898.1 ankyrin repeat protein [Armatimonas rosea]
MKRRWFLAMILPIGLTALLLARRSRSRPSRLSGAFETQVLISPDTPANHALYTAVSQSDVVGVQHAFANGASANATLSWKMEGVPPEQQQAPSPFILLVQPQQSDESDKPQAIAIFREFLAHHLDIHATSAEGICALHIATRLGDLDLVKEVLARGADINAPSQLGGTPLQIAMMPTLRDKEGPEVPLIQFLLESGANPNSISPANGTTPLMQAALMNHPKTVALLLEHGADPALVNQSSRSRTSRTFTALELAQSAGSEEVVRLLRATHPNMTAFEAAVSGAPTVLKKHLDSGTSPNSRDKNGSPLLFLAAQSGSAEAVQLLLERGADPSAATQPPHFEGFPPEPGTRGSTPLHTAAAHGFVAVMQLLIAHKADLDALAGRADSPETALTKAVQANEAAAVKLLLEHGAKVGDALERCVQSKGQMPLRRRGESPTKRRSKDVIQEQQEQIYTLLMAQTKDAESQGKALCTALDMGELGLAEDLLKRGADVNVRGRDEKTPLFSLIHYLGLTRYSLSEMHKQQPIVAPTAPEALVFLEQLLAHKPDLSVTLPPEQDWKGGTALAYARYFKLPAVVERLQKAGLKR